MAGLPCFEVSGFFIVFWGGTFCPFAKSLFSTPVIPSNQPPRKPRFHPTVVNHFRPIRRDLIFFSTTSRRHKCFESRNLRHHFRFLAAFFPTGIPSLKTPLSGFNRDRMTSHLLLIFTKPSYLSQDCILVTTPKVSPKSTELTQLNDEKISPNLWSVQLFHGHQIFQGINDIEESCAAFGTWAPSRSFLRPPKDSETWKKTQQTHKKIWKVGRAGFVFFKPFRVRRPIYLGKVQSLKTNSKFAPENWAKPQKERIIFQPSIFRGFCC